MRGKWQHSVLTMGLILALTGCAFGDVIVGYERSGDMINIPTARVLDPRFFSLGASTSQRSEASRTDNAVRFNLGTPGGIEVGFTGYREAVAVHAQKSLFASDRAAVSLGVLNIFYKSAVEDTIPEDPSFYAVAENHLVSFFDLDVHVGIGTNRFVRFGRRTEENYGMFAGLARRFGRFKLMLEYDSQNVNLGSRVTVSEGVDLLLGFLGVEHLGKTESEVDAFRGVLGFVFNVSRIPEKLVEREVRPEVEPAALPSVEREPLFMVPEWEPALRDSLDLYRKMAESLADTLERYKYTLKNLQDYLAYSKQRLIVLEDSLYTYREREDEAQRGLNQALRLLTLSLNSYYTGDYPKASAQIKQAISINPNIALAYARLGSVYYKMGQVDKAMAAWETALELDPNFEDVRNILNTLRSRGSRSVTMGNKTRR